MSTINIDSTTLYDTAPVAAPAAPAAPHPLLARIQAGMAKAVAVVTNPNARVPLHFAVNLPHHYALLRTMRHASLAQTIALRPDTRYRYLRNSYLAGHFPIAQRVQIIRHHHACVAQLLKEDFLMRAHKGGHLVWDGAATGHDTSITLRYTERHNTDGDLCLAFKMEGTEVYVMTFTIIPGSAIGHPDRNVLMVASMQGVNGRFELIKKATEACNEVAPPLLLIAAAEALALQLGITTLVGLGNKAAASGAVATSPQRYPFNYDAFWTPIVGEKNAANRFIMPLPFADKPIQTVQAKHRSRALKRREVRNAMRELIMGQVNQYVRLHCLK